MITVEVGKAFLARGEGLVISQRIADLERIYGNDRVDAELMHALGGDQWLRLHVNNLKLTFGANKVMSTYVYVHKKLGGA